MFVRNDSYAKGKENEKPKTFKKDDGAGVGDRLCSLHRRGANREHVQAGPVAFPMCISVSGCRSSAAAEYLSLTQGGP